jgi:hypothetical protein
MTTIPHVTASGETTLFAEGDRIPGTDLVLVNRDHLRMMVGELSGVQEMLERLRDDDDAWTRIQDGGFVYEWERDYNLVCHVISIYEE